MNKKCIFLLPYFGPFPIYFQLFLDTFAFNKTFNMLLITDNDLSKYKMPPNVISLHISFLELKDKIRNALKMEIKLPSPYKLCDFKPAYGFVFFEEIQGYSYWGHCDCDLIFGDLSKLDPLIKEGYDKLFCSGHMTLYKNNIENNSLFMRDFCGRPLFKEAFSTNDIFGFDEDYFQDNIQSIYLNNHKIIYTKDLCFNPDMTYYNFRRRYYDPSIRQWITDSKFSSIFWENGTLYSISSHKTRATYLYCHLQGRKPKFKFVNDYKSILIRPDKISCSSKTAFTRHFVFNLQALIAFAKRIKYCFYKKKDPKCYRNYIEYIRESID
jgi:hypothetical protein